jgi:hypothetical protein
VSGMDWDAYEPLAAPVLRSIAQELGTMTTVASWQAAQKSFEAREAAQDAAACGPPLTPAEARSLRRLFAWLEQQSPRIGCVRRYRKPTCQYYHPGLLGGDGRCVASCPYPVPVKAPKPVPVPDAPEWVSLFDMGLADPADSDDCDEERG